MDRLSAKIETSVVKVMSRSTDIDPTIASPPTSIGSAAATRPPNTHTSTRKLSGIAMDSIKQQVALGLGVDLGVDHGHAARAHGDAVTVVDDVVGQCLGVLLCVVLAAGDAGDDQPGLAVSADELGRGLGRHGPGRRDLGDVR